MYGIRLKPHKFIGKIERNLISMHNMIYFYFKTFAKHDVNFEPQRTPGVVQRFNHDIDLLNYKSWYFLRILVKIMSQSRVKT